MNLKLTKLNQNQRGWSHWIVPLVVVALIAVIGVKLLTSSHALTPAFYRKPVTINLTDVNNGQTVNLKVSDSVSVKLPNAAWVFAQPSVPTVLSLISNTVVAKTTTSPGSTTDNFRGLSTGTSVISATLTTRPVCMPGQICSNHITISKFKVTANVSARQRCTTQVCPF